MSVLSDFEKEDILRTYEENITSAGTQGTRYTPDPAETNRFGNDDIAYIAGDTFYYDFEIIEADVLEKKKADAIINILPTQSMNKGDRVQLADSVWYKVNLIEEPNHFGAITHKILRLVLRHE